MRPFIVGLAFFLSVTSLLQPYSRSQPPIPEKTANKDTNRLIIEDSEAWQQLVTEQARLQKEFLTLRGNGQIAEALAAGEKMLASEKQLLHQLQGQEGPVAKARRQQYQFDAAGSLYELRQLYTIRKDYVAARKAIEDEFSFRRLLLGDRSWLTNDSKRALEELQKRQAAPEEQQLQLKQADQLYAQFAARLQLGQAQAALDLAHQVLKLREEALGSEHPTTAACLNDIAMMYQSQLNYGMAERFFQRSQTIRETALGPEHPETATSLFNLGNLYQLQANYARAELLQQRCLKIREKALGVENSDTAASLISLAQAYDAQTKYALAEPLYQRAVKIYQNTLGSDHLTTLAILTSQADNLRNQGKAVEAEPLYLSLLKYREMAFGPEHLTIAFLLNSLANVYDNQAKHALAEPLYQRALKICEASLGSKDPNTAIVLNNQAANLRLQGKAAEAEPIYQRLLRSHEESLAPDDLSTAFLLNNLAQTYDAQRKYAQAEPLYTRAYKILDATQGSENPNTVTVLSNQADNFRAQRKHAAAERLYEQLVQTREKTLGPDHQMTAFALNSLALTNVEQAKYSQAETLYQRAIKILETQLGAAHLETAMCLSNMAELYRESGDFSTAEKLSLRVLQARENAWGPNHAETAYAMNALALSYVSQGKFSLAEPVYERALKILVDQFGADNPETATCLQNLAVLQMETGQYAAAEPSLRRVLNIREVTIGHDHPLTASTLNNIGVLYEKMGNTAAAVAHFRRALAIFEKMNGPIHPETAVCLDNLAFQYVQQARFSEAESLYKRAIAMDESTFGRDSAAAGMKHMKLGNLYREQGEYSRAEESLRRALRIHEVNLGATHPRTGFALFNTGSLYLSMKNYGAALPLYQRSLEIFERALGPHHPETAKCLSGIAYLQLQIGELEAAAVHAARAHNIRRRLLNETAAVQTEHQQFQMAYTIGDSLNLWLTVTQSDPKSTSEIYDEVVRWKGLITSRQVALRAALHHDPTFAEFRRITQQLSTITLNPPRPPTDPKALEAWRRTEADTRRLWKDRCAALEEEHQRIESELARKSAAFRQTLEQTQIGSKDIIAELRAQKRPTAVVDLLEYHACGRMEAACEQRIVAFVVRADQPITRIELGSARVFQKLITEWRKTYGRKSVEMDTGAELRQLLWEPLAGHLQGIETVLISPDGNLSQIPWGALPGDRPGRYLLEDLAIAVLPVPQLLTSILREERLSGPPPSLLIAGDIDYGGDPGQSQDLLVKREAAGRPPGGMLFSFSQLPSGQAELSSIERRYVKKVPNGKVYTLDQRDATEAAFREQASRHAWLHIITHGYFAPPELTSLLRENDRIPHANDSVNQQSTAEQSTIGGIGASLRVDNGKCIVISVIPGGAAHDDGRMKDGDEIIAISRADGELIQMKGQSFSNFISVLRGPINSTVRLQIRHESNADETVEIELKRKAVRLDSGTESIHPGLLSGLAFAGVNSSPELDKDDGILTAMDVVALDLKLVDTVVLSACETGLGPVAGGEGLLGLQRAFQVAGAKTVVASLWKVPDAATTRLMQRLYENLWDKRMGKLEALREAQLWQLRDNAMRGLILEKDAQGETLSPFYWAGFVLSGDWR